MKDTQRLQWSFCWEGKEGKLFPIHDLFPPLHAVFEDSLSKQHGDRAGTGKKVMQLFKADLNLSFQRQRSQQGLRILHVAHPN